MFECAPNSLSFNVRERRFGLQDCGVSPGGASDQLAFETARIMLGMPKVYHCAEILFCRHVTFTQSVLFVLTGAHCEKAMLKGKTVEHAAVCHAKPGDVLTLSRFIRGFRLYLFATPLNADNQNRIGLQRGPFEKWFASPPPKIRLFKGAEYHLLKNPEAFFSKPWKISNRSDRMGLRLEGQKLEAVRYDIISSTVDDGTVQLTPSGPIILMRNRQTTGGYPRIFQVARVDIDLLAQYTTIQRVGFQYIDYNKADQELEKYQLAFQKFQNNLYCSNQLSI